MRMVELSTIEEYLKLIKQSKEENIRQGNFMDFLFRGQTVDSPLMPKICRMKAKGELLDVEALLLHEFKRSNPLLVEGPRSLDDWDYLTLGQNYGLPTRLLDWSVNALTALWFATERTPDNNHVNPYSVVWILMARTEDFELNMEALHPFDVSETKIVQPRIIKQRINNQSGVFSIHSSADILEKRNMDEAESYVEKLIKVKIPVESFKDIRTDLNTFGVNAFSIFPELEGLCSHLQWRYFE